MSPEGQKQVLGLSIPALTFLLGLEMVAGILPHHVQPECSDIATFCKDSLVGYGVLDYLLPLVNFLFNNQSTEKGRWCAWDLGQRGCVHSPEADQQGPVRAVPSHTLPVCALGWSSAQCSLLVSVVLGYS